MVGSISNVTTVKVVPDFEASNEEDKIEYDQWEDENGKLRYFNLNTTKPPEIVVLDVGGRKFFVFASVFSTWPNTRLNH